MLRSKGQGAILALQCHHQSCTLALRGVGDRQCRQITSSPSTHQTSASSRLPSPIRKQLELYSPVDTIISYMLFRPDAVRTGRNAVRQPFPALDLDPSVSANLESVIAAQLGAVKTPREFMRVVSVALNDPEGAQCIEKVDWLSLPVFKSIDNPLSWMPRLSRLAARLDKAGLEVKGDLVLLMLRLAARSYSASGMKYWLKTSKARELGLSEEKVAVIIQDLLFGWKHFRKWSPESAEAMRQVFFGFEDAGPLAPYHLHWFCQKPTWAEHKIRAVLLADCRDVNGVWEIWKSQQKSIERQQKPAKVGRREFLIEALLEAGGYEKAWQAVKDSQTGGGDLKESLVFKLLDHLEFAKTWDEIFQRSLETKWTHSMHVLEKELNLEWKPSGGGGYHVFKDSELMWNHLSGSEDSKGAFRAKQALDLAMNFPTGLKRRDANNHDGESVEDVTRPEADTERIQ